MIDITISGTVIPFPTTEQAPDWSEPIVQFAQATADALNGIQGPNDVPPQVYTMTSNTNNNVPLPTLAFSTTQVRGANIRYSVYRNSTTTTVTEQGNIIISYNPTNTTGNLWEISRDYVGDALITFVISDTGTFSFSTTALGGTYNTGKLSFAGQALAQTA